MNVLFNNESTYKLPQPFIDECIDLADYVLMQEQAPFYAQVSLTLVDEDEIAALNKEYREKEGPTDVLSFPCDESAVAEARTANEDANFDDDPTAVFWAEYNAVDAAEEEGEELEPLLLGDVVIAPVVAAKNAAELSASPDGVVPMGAVYNELRLLVVHGVLHLMGYDHTESDEQAEDMEQREREILADWSELSKADLPFGGAAGGCGSSGGCNARQDPGSSRACGA